MASRKKQLRKMARTVIKDEILEEHEERKQEVKELREENNKKDEKVKDLENKLQKAKKESSGLSDLLTKSELKAILEVREEKVSGSKKELLKRVKNG